MSTPTNMDELMNALVTVIHNQQLLINSIANKLDQLTPGGGGGSASIEDYESNKNYKRNMLIVDPNTETVYRVIEEYTSETVQTDCQNGYLKLVGYESQFVTFSHNPSQEEINNIPEDSLVAIYSPTDTPYTPTE